MDARRKALVDQGLDSASESLIDTAWGIPLNEDLAIGPRLTLGERLADVVAMTVGSWRFIVVQLLLLAAWIALNVRGWIGEWDPYPFILLNLILSFQAAYTAPIIMMSQNRQAAMDRFNAESDCKVNVQAELAIEDLHRKIDGMRDHELAEIARLLVALDRRLTAVERSKESARR